MPAGVDPVEALGRALGGEQAPVGGPRTPYGAFMGLKRNVDPDADLASTAPRIPKYVIAAVTLVRNSSGRSAQQIYAEALTGKTPIPAAALDAAFMELYGYERPPVQP